MSLTPKLLWLVFCSFLKFGWPSFDAKFLKPLVLIDLFIMNMKM